MGLLETLTTDMKAAMKARESARLATVRLLIAAVKNAQIDKGGPLDEAEEVDLLAREAKRRRESIEAYARGGRQELVDQETAELAVIEAYLPQALTEAEVRQILAAAIAETGATSMKEMGKVMGRVMPQLRGRFDGKAVRPLLEELLG